MLYLEIETFKKFFYSTFANHSNIGVAAERLWLACKKPQIWFDPTMPLKNLPRKLEGFFCGF
jgi:hypothetical protein